MVLIDELEAIVGPEHVLTGKAAEARAEDATRTYHGTPLAIVRPASTAEVSAVMRATFAAGVPVVPEAGGTNVTGAAHAPNAVKLSLARMNQIREIRKDARLAIVEAGVILSKLHDKVADDGLLFPVTFGAQGSAMIGGILSTHAGGSNVLRYGSTRAMTLGIEVVLPSGEVLNLMSELHKDNSGYALRELFIGAEGTLGVITAAVLKLERAPRAYATAMVAATDLPAALRLLNALQDATGGAVECFELMPRSYIERHLKHAPDARPPFAKAHDVNILAEIAATTKHDATPGPDGVTPLAQRFEDTLAELFEAGALLDAVVAKSGAERREMWARREAAFEIGRSNPNQPCVEVDIALPLDRLDEFLSRVRREVVAFDPDAEEFYVSHLGDGNIHYLVYPKDGGPATKERVMSIVEDLVVEMGGSFSAEHGIGLSKLGSMARRKDPTALALMRQIKASIDPKGLMNPGKVLPPV